MSGAPKTVHINKMLVYAASANAPYADVSAAQDEVLELLAALAERDKLKCCANCDHCWGGWHFCKEDESLSVDASDYCHFEPSSWIGV